VALYFAVETDYDLDGAVYALRAPKRVSDEKIETVSPFKIEKVYKFIPVNITQRLVIQEGLFTIHPELEVPLQNTLSSNSSPPILIVTMIPFGCMALWSKGRCPFPDVYRVIARQVGAYPLFFPCPSSLNL